MPSVVDWDPSAGPLVTPLDNRTMIQLLAQHNAKTIDSLATSLNRVAHGLSNKVESVDRKVDSVQGKVGALDDKVGAVDGKLEQLREQIASNEFKRGKRSQFLPYLPVLFDGQTGECGWVPTGFRDSQGVYRECVVISIGYMVRFFGVECPVRISEAETTSFFTSEDNFPRSSHLVYKDYIRLLMQTPFNFLAVGPRWMNKQKENRHRFVVTPMSTFKNLLADIRVHFPDGPTSRNFLDRPSYKSEGNAYAYMNKSKSDSSTGTIVAIKKSLSLEEKRRIPALCRPWVVENYNPVVKDFFGIPPDLVGKRHVVAGVFKASSSRVKFHAQVSCGMLQAKRKRGAGTKVSKNKR